MTVPHRVALVGYGVGGRLFHAPFIDAADGVELDSIVTRAPTRRMSAREDFPGVAVVDDLESALRRRPGLVVITTPPETRRELVLRAIEAGVAVIADKPFAPDERTATELRDAASSAAVPLGVFYNRRWDADIQTVAGVVDCGRLGTVQRFTSRMDQDDPSTFEATPGGGLLRDLGSHLVDQALWLFGEARSVYAELDWVETRTGMADAGFVVALTHRSGVRSTLSASKLNRAAQRELRVLGSAGSFRSDSTDVQFDALRAGRRPATSRDWGFEHESRWGVLSTAEGRVSVPSARGAYQEYYAAVARALSLGCGLPVTADDGVAVARVLDAARASDASRQVLVLGGS